jgi:hypothetical protein
MPDLFPTTLLEPSTIQTENSQVTFGSSFKFDFAAGDFVMTPTGKVMTMQHIDAWAEWCQKALMTPRYRFLVYGRNYGQEFEDMIGRSYIHEAAESEIRRMAEECLKVDPRTAEVKNFSFSWDESQVFYKCEVTNVLGEKTTIFGKAVIA